MSGERPSARPPARVRIPRALGEFVAVPLLVVAALLVLAVASIYGDQAHGPALTTLRGAIGHLIGKQAASAALGAIATGLVTVTSITFSVLLLAVQQTASSLSPVVFDQFVRRRANQVFLGLFVGLALYAYVVLAAVQKDTPPIIGAFLATLLTVAALCCLLFLVYSTIDQMRPRNVVRQLHDRAAGAHNREAPLIARTRRHSRSRLPVRAEYRSDTFGYVESIDLDLIAEVLDDDRGDGDGHSRDDDPAGRPEVELHVTVGTEVALGDLVAFIRTDDSEKADRVRERLGQAVAMSPAPDLDFDATIGIRDLSNIGWTSGSTSKQNPAIAAQALHALRDLAVRWSKEGDRTGPDPLPVVYADHDVDTVLNALYSAIVAAHESHQHGEAARVLDTYTAILAHAPGAVADRIRTDLEAMQPLLDQMPASPQLDAARRRADGAAHDRGRTNGRSRPDARQRLSEAGRQAP
ncbi:MAG: DUF2254 family protein [Nocardioides sp.]